MFRLAAITDEFSPDLNQALSAMKDCSMTGAELRTIGDRNIVDLSDAEIRAIGDAVSGEGFEVVSIASPLLKCELPGAPVDSRFQRDVFASSHTFEDQPRLTARCIEIAERLGCSIIRVFSYWRATEPDKYFDAVAAALLRLADDGARRGIIIGVENEHACNVATATEAARLLDAARHPNLKLIWDPANCYVSGENPFPEGYAKLPKDRIVHVHAKDCRMGPDHTPEWGPLGERDIDWRGQLGALRADHYTGWISLETHWRGDDRMEASRICGLNLRKLFGSR